jgi:CSLREA domain-containing protein
VPRLLTYAATSLALFASLVVCASAEARTITADRASERDIVMGTAGCTLREAIKAINQRINVNGCLAGNGSNDTINLLAGTTYLVHLATNADSLTISRPVTIAGGGVESTILKPDTGGNANMFVIASASTVSFQGVTMRDISGAHAIYVNSGASARVSYSWFINVGTSSGSTGGAVVNYGAMSIYSVEFSGCRGWGAGSLTNKGTIYVQDSSFIEGNGARAGAFLNEGATATATVINCTFGKNVGANQATAIRNGGGATLDLQSSTVINNRSTFETFAIGAVHNESGTLKIKNTFISSNLNASSSPSSYNCVGSITSQATTTSAKTTFA